MWFFITLFATALDTVFRRKWSAIRTGAKWTKIWSKISGKIIGMKVAVHGDTGSVGGKLIVSNHTGYLDIVAQGTLFPLRFAPKIEMRSWPLFGQLIELSHPVWVDRVNRSRAGRTAQEFKETLENNLSLLVYPEGTSTDGRSGILPFKSTAFDAAEATGCPVIELLLFFSCPDDPGKSSAWFGDTPFGTYLWHAIGLKKVEAVVYIIGVTQIVEGENRKTLAERVHDEMSQAYWRIMHNEEL